MLISYGIVTIVSTICARSFFNGDLTLDEQKAEL